MRELETTAEHIGNAAVHLLKAAGKAKSVYALHGDLYLSQSGWLLVDVPNSLVRGAFDALNEPGVELPYKDDKLNAHISVMTEDEVKKIGPDQITERGHSVRYTLSGLKEVQPSGWDDVSKVWFIEVRSQDLEKIRKSYGLSPLPNSDHPFHITIAKRKKHVLHSNEISKAASIADKHIYITGHSGAGKSTYAKQLSKELNLPLAHLDDEPGFREFLENDKEQKHLNKGSPEYDQFHSLSQDIVHSNLANLSTPHILEGAQILRAHLSIPTQARKVLVEAPEETIINNRLRRHMLRALAKGQTILPGSPEAESKISISKRILDADRDHYEQFKKLPGVELYKPFEKESDCIDPEEFLLEALKADPNC